MLKPILNKSSLSKPIIGWDIGGAHLKAVLLDANGDVLNIKQLPCPLWRGNCLIFSTLPLASSSTAFKCAPPMSQPMMGLDRLGLDRMGLSMTGFKYDNA